jgi:putative transposase
VTYEEVYLNAYLDGTDAKIGIGDYFRFYNNERHYQARGYRTPAEVFTVKMESVCGGVLESQT